jgi:hypothetical protein
MQTKTNNVPRQGNNIIFGRKKNVPLKIPILRATAIKNRCPVIVNEL